jgi:tRNA A-37 threonylcarbamoyl transferase component Bud32
MPSPYEISEEPLLELYDDALATADAPDVAELLGDGTARYAIIEPIGEGAWKRVSLAHDLMTGRDVAMCVPRKASTEEQTQRFIHEGRILARLEHAAILRLYDLGLDASGSPFFVTKYVAGKTLESIIRKLAKGETEVVANWPLFRRLESFNQICAGVAYAHSRGVVHRDLKPENVLIDQYGQVLVCDWGLARLIDEADAHEPLLMDEKLSSTELRLSTLDGVIKGTPGYMAPEQAAADAKAVSNRTDVYALGAVLYTLLVFRPPIDGRDLADVRHRTINGQFPPPEAVRPDLGIPPGLSAVVMKALATSPNRRYQSVGELIADLSAFTTGFAPTAQAAGPATRLWLFMRRHKTAAIATAAGLAIAAGLAVHLHQTESRHAEQEARLEARQIEMAEDLEASKLAARTAQEWVEIERRNREQYAEDATVFIVDRCVTAYKLGDFTTAFDQLNSATALSQNNERMWRIKSILHLARFEIDEAITAGDKAVDKSFFHQTRIAHSFRDRQQPEHYRELFDFLHSKHDAKIWRASATLYPPTIPDPAQRYAVRMFLLKKINPQQKSWSPIFVPTLEGNTMTVDLRGHNALTDVQPLLGHDVVELDLRDTAVKFNSYLTNARHIKRIIITPAQKKAAVAAKLADRIVITDFEPRPAVSP